MGYYLKTPLNKGKAKQILASTAVLHYFPRG